MTGSPISLAPRRALYLDEIARDGWPVHEIGFTGGEPFMNPDMLGMLGDALGRGFSVAGADQRHAAHAAAAHPRRVGRAARGLWEPPRHPRVSLDHYSMALHEEERGRGHVRQDVEGDRLARGTKASRSRLPGAPAGARARRTRAPATRR